MNIFTKITPEILKNSGYKKSYFPFTRYTKKVEDNIFSYIIYFEPDSKENAYVLTIHKYLKKEIGMVGNCVLKCINSCEKANKLIEVFTDDIGTLSIPE